MAKMYRVPLNEWRKNFFAVKPPPLKRLKDNIKAGKLPGEEIGQGTGIYIMHCDADYNPIWPNNHVLIPQTGNAIVDNILQRYQGQHAST